MNEAVCNTFMIRASTRNPAVAARSARIRTGVRALAYAAAGFAWILSSGACSLYTGSATTLKPSELNDPGWVKVEGVPELRQTHELDCGPTALAMVLRYYDAASKADVLSQLPSDQRIAVSELRDVAKHYGFDSFVVEGKPEDLVFELQRGHPLIVGVAKPTLRDAVAHYEVVIGLNRAKQQVATLDPAVGLRQNSFSGFLTEWQGAGRVLLVVLPRAPSSERAGVAEAAHGQR